MRASDKAYQTLLDEIVEIGFGHRADQGRIMRPRAARIEMRPLQMEANKPPMRNGRRNHSARSLWCIGDQRRQDCRSALPRMGSADLRNRLGGTGAIQHHPAAAVHLQIHESGADRAG